MLYLSNKYWEIIIFILWKKIFNSDQIFCWIPQSSYSVNWLNSTNLNLNSGLFKLPIKSIKWLLTGHFLASLRQFSAAIVRSWYISIPQVCVSIDDISSTFKNRSTSTASSACSTWAWFPTGRWRSRWGLLSLDRGLSFFQTFSSHSSTELHRHTYSWRLNRFCLYCISFSLLLFRKKAVCTENKTLLFHELVSVYHSAVQFALCTWDSHVGSEKIGPFEVIYEHLILRHWMLSN